ncbi:hypothetical protein SCHPADRAFT_893656 [Schizopora paradoxa]|uniref:Uncharacterized protein n=1 Tax=Schizopora paradoxa TaxID=27342 RepID=A0A0H2RA04_9AGAM|nr:hypothetical protein SCHPADRAFT_893656 [Schizopora paradoxa]
MPFHLDDHHPSIRSFVRASSAETHLHFKWLKHWKRKLEKEIETRVGVSAGAGFETKAELALNSRPVNAVCCCDFLTPYTIKMILRRGFFVFDCHETLVVLLYHILSVGATMWNDWKNCWMEDEVLTMRRMTSTLDALSRDRPPFVTLALHRKRERLIVVVFWQPSKSVLEPGILYQTQRKHFSLSPRPLRIRNFNIITCFRRLRATVSSRGGTMSLVQVRVVTIAEVSTSTSISKLLPIMTWSFGDLGLGDNGWWIGRDFVPSSRGVQLISFAKDSE